MKIKFSKISNNHQKLRDDVIEGTTDTLPEIGNPFYFSCPPRDIPFGMRLVNTSPITDIKKNGNLYIVATESGSVYEIEIQKED